MTGFSSRDVIIDFWGHESFQKWPWGLGSEEWHAQGKIWEKRTQSSGIHNHNPCGNMEKCIFFFLGGGNGSKCIQSKKWCVFRFFSWQLYNKTIPTVENTDLPCTALLQEHLRSLTQHHREAAKTVRELRQAEDHRKVQEVEQSKAQEQRQKMKSQRQDLSLWMAGNVWMVLVWFCLVDFCSIKNGAPVKQRKMLQYQVKVCRWDEFYFLL